MPTSGHRCLSAHADAVQTARRSTPDRGDLAPDAGGP